MGMVYCNRRYITLIEIMIVMFLIALITGVLAYNYRALFEDASARAALTNTFLFTFGAVALETLLGLSVALLLWRDDWFNRIALGLLLLPATGVLLPDAVAADDGSESAAGALPLKK